MEKTLTIRLPDTLLAQIHARAAELEASPSSVARDALIQAFNGSASEARILAAFSAAAADIEKQASARAAGLTVILKAMDERLKKLAPK